ncbi:11158_t:CDS:2, partial [Funneliformis caledonium]
HLFTPSFTPLSTPNHLLYLDSGMYIEKVTSKFEAVEMNIYNLMNKEK